MNTSESRTLSVTADVGILEKILTQYLHRDEWTPIREYIANAHDASRGESQPFIRVWADRSQSAIHISDHGCGMTEDVITKAFTAIGGHFDQGEVGRPVGRFGLGVLSAFMIADRLVVETWSKHEKHGWRIDWRRHQGSYDLTPIERSEYGTQATLYVDAEHRKLVSDGDIADAVQRCMGLFITPIYVGEKGERPANKHCEWLRQQMSDPTPTPRLLPLKQAREVMRTYCKLNMLAIYGMFTLDGPSLILGIPDEEQATGSLYGHHTWFFCQGILVEKSVEKYFPENLAFVCGFFEHPDYKLQITREGLITDDCFTSLKRQVGDHVVEFLELLARHDPATMEKVLRIHRTMLQVYASKDKRLIYLFRNHYRFMTTNGELLWSEIITSCPSDRKTVHVLSVANPQLHLQDVARARNVLLVITSEVESQLLEEIANTDGYRVVNAAQLMNNNGQQDMVAEPFMQLVQRLALPMSRHGIPRLKPTGQLRPDSGPALLEVEGTDKCDAARVAGLFLNVRHPLIEVLAMSVTELNTERLQRAADILFYIAVLNPQSHFQNVALGAATQIAAHLAYALTREIERPHAGLESREKAQCLVALPHEPSFRAVWQAVQGVLSGAPYHWQLVRSDETLGADVLKGPLELVAASRRFVADISGRDQNVLLELGMMLARDREATIILSDRETFQHLPAKLKGSICMVYDAHLRQDVVAMRKWIEGAVAKHPRFISMQGSPSATVPR